LLRVAVTIALVGDKNDAHPSHRELDAARAMLGPDVVTEWSGRSIPCFANLSDVPASMLQTASLKRILMLPRALTDFRSSSCETWPGRRTPGVRRWWAPQFATM
jgi:hypothetical protein